MVVLTGRMTRLQRYMVGMPKVYRAEAKLGWRSSTGDPDGELVETGRLPASLELPTGRIRQKVPMTSAVKVDGERLYRKAHRGESVDTPEREVTIYSATLLGHHDDLAEYEISCSSGTYIRSLIETLSDAYCSKLHRIAVGHLRLGETEREEIAATQALAFMPSRELSQEEADSISKGQAISVGELLDPRTEPAFAVEQSKPDGPRPVALTRQGTLIAVARARDDRLRPEVVLV